MHGPCLTLVLPSCLPSDTLPAPRQNSRTSTHVPAHVLMPNMQGPSYLAPILTGFFPCLTQGLDTQQQMRHLSGLAKQLAHAAVSVQELPGSCLLPSQLPPSAVYALVSLRDKVEPGLLGLRGNSEKGVQVHC